MLTIRDSQVQVLEGALYRQFEALMLVHLRSVYGAPIFGWTDDDVRSLIQEGTERARRYGITASYDVCRFIECIMTYGEDFDTNPAMPWAGQILRLTGPSGRERMDLIDGYEHLLVHGSPPPR